MAETTISQDLNALFKEVYAKKIENLVPESIIALNEIRFSEQEKIGDSLHVPLRLESESNFDITDTDLAIALSEPKVARYATAVIKPSTIVLQSQISYQQANKALSKKQSVETAAYEVMESMKKSMERKLEEMMFYGGNRRTAVNTTRETNTPDDTSDRIHLGGGANDSLTIDVSSAADAKLVFTNVLAPGLEVRDRLVGCKVVIRATEALAGTDRTGVNPGDILATFVIKAGADSNRSITFTPNAATTSTHGSGDIRLRHSDYIDVYASDGNPAFRDVPGFDGMDTIIGKTTGTQYGLDVNDSSGYLKSPPIRYNTGVLTVIKVNQISALVVENGAEGRLTLYINPDKYTNLTKELNDRLQVGDHLEIPYSKGVIVVRPSIYVYKNDGFLVNCNDCRRVGTNDVTFTTPGMDDTVFHRMQENLGFIVRCWTQQALFIAKPAQCMKLYGI